MVRPWGLERVLAEAAARLRESNRLLALAEAAVPLGHWRYDVASRSFDCSPGLSRIAGLPRSVAIDPSRLLALVHPDDWRPVLRAFARARRTGDPSSCSARLTGKDRPVRLAVAPEHHEGRLATMVGLVHEAPGDASPCLWDEADGAGSGALDVLVAEDVPVNQTIVRAHLQRLGHCATFARNGRIAVELARERRFDCILMDIQMPELDGLAATRLIRASGGASAAAPIVALTADASPERRRFTDKARFDGFLTKPIDVEALRRVLDGIASARIPAEAELFDRTRYDELCAALGPRQVAGLLDLLIGECGQRPARIRDLAGRGDLDGARAEAHSLKGAAGNLGATALGEAAGASEAARDLQSFTATLAELDRQARRTARAIAALR